MKKIRVGIVNYLNTRPLLFGLHLPPISDKIQITGDYPVRLVEKLINDEIDIGLIPVAALPSIPEYYLVGNHCIGAEGEIASVAIFSEVPMNEIREIYLDYQSRTSVELLQYLLNEFWGVSPALIKAEDENYRNKIAGTTAGLVIGDRALEQRKISSYIYDLGSEWKSITGLPFVFAAWVSIKKLPDDFIELFDKANAVGLSHIDEIVAKEQYTLYDLKKYYTVHLSYYLDDAKRKGMEFFLNYLKNK